ncbi:MAG: sensor histidine kinase [Butyricicoccus sp.]
MSGEQLPESTAHILIVDDLPDHLAFAGTILRQQGYRVHAATSGRAALAFLEKRLPDLIVLDIHIEGMDGLERPPHQGKQADKRNSGDFAPQTAPEVITAGFDAGCCDYVPKPFVRAEYLARISAHLRIARQNKALRTAYEELDRFCSAVSHDLKSPLSVMRMLLSMLKDELGDSVPDEAAHILGILDGKAELLTAMVERLLEFSRMCSIRPNMVPLDMGTLLHEVYDEQRLAEPERQVELEMEPLLTVHGDAVLVRMLLKNIISNAFKFTRGRENAKITVTAGEEDDFTVIAVRDNGAGFDMQYADRLFRIFQRLHDDSEFEGTGVGLAMAQRIMERHGGKIRMTGEVNNGATVFLYFPQE